MKKLILTIFILTVLFGNISTCFASGYQYKGNIIIHISDRLDTTKQSVTREDIVNALDKIPLHYTKSLDVYLLDTASNIDPNFMGAYYWEEDKIEIYRTDINDGYQNMALSYNGLKITIINVKRDIDKLVAHEVGHRLYKNIVNDYARCYEKIAEKEKKFSVINIREDFADSFSLYILDTENFKENCPGKYVFFEMMDLRARTGKLSIQ